MDTGICGHSEVLELAVLEEKVISLSLPQPSSPVFKPHGGLWLSHSLGHSLQTTAFLCVMTGHAWTTWSSLQPTRTTWDGERQFPNENNEVLGRQKQTSTKKTLMWGILTLKNSLAMKNSLPTEEEGHSPIVIPNLTIASHNPLQKPSPSWCPLSQKASCGWKEKRK